jgi:hypothetical protein
MIYVFIAITVVGAVVPTAYAWRYAKATARFIKNCRPR